MSDVPSRLTLMVCENLSLAMILLRRGSADAVSRVLLRHRGIELPSHGRLSAAPDVSVLWSGPDRFLAVREAPDPQPLMELGTALDGLAYVVEASNSRLVLQVAGCGAAEALNRLLPIDLHPRAFTPGSVALTSAGHIAVQVWRDGNAPAFRLACGSSFGASLRRQLEEAGFGSARE